MKSWIHYFAVSVIIVLSFFCYSSNFYPLLGSDDAVVVLMIHNFQLPHDLYFWGQDRYGSLVPLLGQVFYKGFGFSPLTSESVTHYLLLVAGYFAFAGLFKSKYSRLILAIAWFFPPIRLIDILRLNIGQEYSLLAISIFLINKVYENKFERYHFKQHILLLSVTVLFVLAVWVSDLAAVSVFLILAIYIYFSGKRINIQKNVILRWSPEIFYFLAGTIAGSAFIFYGKYYADKSEMYNSFNDFHSILTSVGLFSESITDLLLFKAGEPFTSAYLILIILFTVILFFLRAKIRFGTNQRKWFWFFVFDFILIFCLIMVSKWSLMNGVPRRYFTSNYITFWMAFLLALECLAETPWKKLVHVGIGVAVLTAGAGSLYNLNYIWPKTLEPRIELVREFESLGRIGIIANYWNSYINSASNPDLIIATPNQQSSIRNRDMVVEVMKRDTFYIIRDGWFEVFPDSINQFGTMLYKNGEEFRMGDCFVCRYRK